MGAVFSSGGATVSYDDGIQAAASGTAGTGGTQRNEFEAAIKSVTSATTVGAVFLYDVSADSDGGAWRKKCKGLSWFDEASSATRSARSEFPAMALIVADNVTAETISIYDLDDPAMPLWMSFTSGGTYPAQQMVGESGWSIIKAVYALNGRVYVGRGTAGVVEINFPADHATRYSTDGAHRYGNIANRDTDSNDVIRDSSAATVNATINDVAATVLEGAEIGALGLPIPTVAVATDGGVSVIHPSGDVFDLVASSTTYAYSNWVAFTDNKRIVFGQDSSGNKAAPRLLYNVPIPYADDTGLNYGTTTTTDKDFSVDRKSVV